MGTTKSKLLEYYIRVGPVLLEHLRDRQWAQRLDALGTELARGRRKR